MISFKDFLRWYNNKEVVLFLLLSKAKNEKTLYHDKGHAETGMHTSKSRKYQLQKLTKLKFYRSLREIVIYARKLEKT